MVGDRTGLMYPKEARAIIGKIKNIKFETPTSGERIAGKTYVGFFINSETDTPDILMTISTKKNEERLKVYEMFPDELGLEKEGPHEVPDILLFLCSLDLD
jgi:hypothetical protein